MMTTPAKITIVLVEIASVDASLDPAMNARNPEMN